MLISIYETLKQIEEAQTRKEKIDLLRTYDNPNIRLILQYALNEDIKWLLPSEIQYKENDLPGQHHMLYSQLRTLYLYVEGGHSNLSQIKREYLFINLLENIDADDARMLISIKNKDFMFKSINRKLVKEAYKGIEL